jgi:hypothetical protein
MTLGPGTKLGPYDIVAPLGAGGMGEVWRARDARLGREVAVKVLPEAFARDPERLARFEREAKAVAALSHPNILAIHDYGTHDGTVYIVTELLDGQTLRARLAEGPLTPRRAVEIAVQVAHGLAAAHDKGIVHRDLKPENLWVGRDGRVKILDFGLARSAAAPGRESSSLAPTEAAGTSVGGLVGTMGYMAPEQVRGAAVDPRTDLFAFGAVLYEMLSGRRAFQGESPADTMSAILREEPPELEGTVRDLPPALERILRRCLEKQPDARFHSAHDLAFALEALSSSSGVSPAGAGAAALARSGRRRIGVPSALAVVALPVAVVVAFLAGRSAPRKPPAYRQLTFQRGYVHSARFAPDHQTVIYGGAFEGRPVALFTTRTDAVDSRALDLPGADVVGVSRSGEMAVLLGRHHVGSWLRLGTLAQVPLAGGSPRGIADSVYDADISPDGERFAVVRAVGSGQQLEFPLGHPLFRTEGWISQPRIAPDGRRVAFAVHPYDGDDIGHVALADGGGRVQTLSKDHNFLQGLCWAPKGDAVWASSGEDEGGELWSASPGRAERLILRAPIAFRIQEALPTGQALIVVDMSRADIVGRLAGDRTDQVHSWWDNDDVAGIATDGTSFAGEGNSFFVSGEYLTYARRNDGRPPVVLGPGAPVAMSPDGRWVLVRTMTRDRDKLRLLPTGTGQARVIELGDIRSETDTGKGAAAFSADGRRLVFIGTRPGLASRAFEVDLPDGRPRPLSDLDAVRVFFSPDGGRVAILDAAGRVSIVPVGSGAPTSVAGVAPGEVPLGWDAAGTGLLVWDRTFPARVSRVDVASGRRSAVREIVPDDPAGILYGFLTVTPDAASYLYRCRRVLSDVYVVTDLR